MSEYSRAKGSPLAVESPDYRHRTLHSEVVTVTNRTVIAHAVWDGDSLRLSWAGGVLVLGPRQARELYNLLYHVLPEGIMGDIVVKADMVKEHWPDSLSGRRVK